MTTNTELINPETEDNDLYITDKIEQIRYIYPHSEKNKAVTINIKMKDEIKISTTIFINQIQDNMGIVFKNGYFR